MENTSGSASSSSSKGGSSTSRYKGVRMRNWGKWVSEIREPNKRSRIWLGSYSSEVAAARAYDFAMVCLRGPNVALNFPDSPPRPPPAGPDQPSLTPKRIQTLAAAFASHYAMPSDRPTSEEAATDADSPRDDECEDMEVQTSSANRPLQLDESLFYYNVDCPGIQVRSDIVPANESSTQGETSDSLWYF